MIDILMCYTETEGLNKLNILFVHISKGRLGNITKGWLVTLTQSEISQ